MALSAEEAQVLADISKELEAASTWHSGARARFFINLAKHLLNLVEGQLPAGPVASTPPADPPAAEPAAVDPAAVDPAAPPAA